MLYLEDYIRSLVVYFLGRSWKSWLANTIAILIANFLVRWFRSWRRLRHINGPALASITRFWLLRTMMSGEMHTRFAATSEEYGPLVRIGPNFVLTDDPVVWRRILAVRSSYQRSDMYLGMRFDPARENVASERNEERHSALRAKMASGYSGKEVEHLEESVDQNIAELIELVNKYVALDGEDKPIDFARKAQFFTLDVISTIAYGEPFGYLSTDSDVYEFIGRTEKVLRAATAVRVFPELNWLLRTSLLKRVLPKDTDELGFGRIMGITRKVVNKRFGPNKEEKMDMLGSFVRHGLGQEEAHSESIIQVLAGSDTTATGIRATFLHIIENPRILSRLREEIDGASISSPITDAEARQLPYLQAVIKEGLRIHPPVPGLAAKKVPKGGDTINGLYVPEGTSIGFSAFRMFRNPKVWGADAASFRPERWLEGPTEQIKAMEHTLELAFAVGKWQCLGKPVALTELNKVFVELLRRFDFAIVDPTKPWKSVCYGTFSQSQMWMTVKKRLLD